MKNFYDLLVYLDDSESKLLSLSSEIDSLNFNKNFRGNVSIKKNILDNVVSRIDGAISNFNNEINVDSISFTKVDGKNSYIRVFDTPTYLKKVKLDVLDFIFEASTNNPPSNFKINFITENDEVHSFNAIPYSFLGDYIELIELGKGQNESLFYCKGDYPFKVYDDSFNLIQNNEIEFKSTGKISIPKLGYEKIYISYTPVYDSYVYDVNRLVRSIEIVTNTPIPEKIISLVNF